MVLSACVYGSAAYTHTHTRRCLSHGCLRLAGTAKVLRLHLHTLASPELLFKPGMVKTPGVLMTSPRSSFWIDHSLCIVAGCCTMSRQTRNSISLTCCNTVWHTTFFSPLYFMPEMHSIYWRLQNISRGSSQAEITAASWSALILSPLRGRLE